MDFRKLFDTIPQQFDRWRPTYCDELFSDLTAFTGLDSSKKVLEIGPGTGQATEPVLQTGCDYLAIELGENFTEVMKEKFSKYNNFRIINDDFITHSFEENTFDLIYSAATIQWIPEESGFGKSFQLLKSGGILAMMFLKGDYKTPNEALYEKIQKVYDEHFHPEIPYNQKFTYENAVQYGFENIGKREYKGRRIFTADEYVQYIGTHSDHIVLKEPQRSKFFGGIHQAIVDEGNRLVFEDTYVLYLAKKP